MKFNAWLCFLFLLAAPGAAPGKEPPMQTKTDLSAAAKYEAPQGWVEEFSLNQGDSQAVLSRGLHKIKIRLSGRADSRSKTANDFLAGLESRSRGGKLAEKTGSAVISGVRVMMYRREIPISLPPPDTAGPSVFAPEEFCVVPVGKMYFILSYSYGDSIPDISYDGLKVWRKFLKNFQILKIKKPGK